MRALHIALDDGRPGEPVESGLRGGEGVFKEGKNWGKGGGGGIHSSLLFRPRDQQRRGRVSEQRCSNFGVRTSDTKILLTEIILTPELGPGTSAFFHHEDEYTPAIS